jgi:nanoRNase/pAp phosphatase (c-di-AMP/oligoRNAs hydrolase)
MGGGGHKKASGFTVEGVLQEGPNGTVQAVGTHPHVKILNDLLKA